MKTFKLSILTTFILAILFNLTSCESENSDILQRPTALVTVYPDGTNGVLLQLDETTKLKPTNIVTSPYGKKIVRALVNYQEAGEAKNDMHEVYVNWMDSIRTKMPVVTIGENDEKVYGSDPIEIVRDWVTVGEDGFLTLRIRTLWGNGKKHVLNLVSGVNKDNAYELTLRHNANGDTKGRVGDALIAFNLNELWPSQTKDVKIKLNWMSFSGSKSYEFSLKMHPSQSFVEMGSVLYSDQVE